MGLCVTTYKKSKASVILGKSCCFCPDTYLVRKYSYGETLGIGRSSRVLECTEYASGKKFALKILSKKNKINKALFDRETEILQLLKHSNIVAFTEAHEDSFNWYILTELCEGGELFDRIVDKNNRITEKLASNMVQTMLLAIGHCHKYNIVHRDIKPENFVFKTKSMDSAMVLIDFGCAKIVEDDTEYADLVGTPFYLAPESAVGRKFVRTGWVLKSSDLWAIGVTAYVIMTGRPPFNGRSNKEIFANIIRKVLKFPSSVNLSKSFIEFCTLILTKSPKKRLALKDALEHPWVQGRGTSGRLISDDVIKVLRQFREQSKLKKVITRTLAAHMGKEMEDKIRKQFCSLDTNRDGVLSAHELAPLLTQIGLTKQQSSLEANKILEMSGSGEIDFNDFAQIWQRRLLTINEEYIRSVFTLLDEDNNGTVDAAELTRVLEMNNEGDIARIEEIIKEVDTNGDGVLSFKEFKEAMLESNFTKVGVNLGLELNANDFKDETENNYQTNVEKLEASEYLDKLDQES